MKKILFLGGAPTQIPPIKYALEEGHYVITLDFLPNNPGHKFAHKYYNISTTDIEAVLEVAQAEKIDGIVAYASDPSAPTAAYVAEKMGLPGNPYESVKILARKDLFREFLAKNNFNVPRSKSFYGEAAAQRWLDEIGVPAFVKPVDSSGSKGVTHLESAGNFHEAFEHALSFSREKKVIVESKIIRHGYQVAGDGFVINGELVFRCWADEHFNIRCNGLVPIGQTFPTSHDKSFLDHAHKEAQRLLDLLDIRTGALNFDFVFSESGDVYFIELGPRNGGCLIPEVINFATGVNLIQCTVDSALGLPCDISDSPPVRGFWSSYMIHSEKEGFFKELWLSNRADRYRVEQDVWVNVDDKVSAFNGSHETLGTMILKYPSKEEMLSMMDDMSKDIYVSVV